MRIFAKVVRNNPSGPCWSPDRFAEDHEQHISRFSLIKRIIGGYTGATNHPQDMKFPFGLLGLSTQLPLQQPSQQPSNTMTDGKAEKFEFKEGTDIFSPKDLVRVMHRANPTCC